MAMVRVSKLLGHLLVCEYAALNAALHNIEKKKKKNPKAKLNSNP